MLLQKGLPLIINKLLNKILYFTNLLHKLSIKAATFFVVFFCDCSHNDNIIDTHILVSIAALKMAPLAA